MVKKFYNKADDIYSIVFGDGYVHSRELNNCNIVIDFGANDEIIGVEIFDIDNRLKESQVKIDKLFEDKNES